MEQKTVFGIDLGTTNSCIARFKNIDDPDLGYLKSTFEIVEIDNANTLPSVVAYDESNQQWLVGESARNYSKLFPSNAVTSIKREMGKIDYKATLGPYTLSAEDISSKILSYLKNKTEEKLGNGIKVEDVVITVPAYFNDLQRRSTLNAGIMAGLNVLRIINEPTAAALVHEISCENEHTRLEKCEKWIVYDLGGGTFDVSIIEARAHYKEVLASTGDNNLGGDDFDNILACYILEQIIKDNPQIKDYINDLANNHTIQAKLKYLAEDIKITLSTQSTKEINDFFELELDYKNIILPIKFTISRNTFQTLIEPFVDSTIELLHQALALANCKIEEISRLLLVGGSTKIPLIKEKLFSAFAIHGDSYIDPDLSVALGAAVQAAISAKLNFDNIVIDVSPHSLGVAAFGHIDIIKQLKTCDQDSLPSKHPKTFIPVITRNSKLPAKFEKTFYTSFPLQEQIEVNIYQGESQNTEENTFIGNFVANLQPNNRIVPLNLSMEYDLNGIIKISISSLQKEKIVNSYRMDLYLQNIELPPASPSQMPSPMNEISTNFLISKVEGLLGKIKEHSDIDLHIKQMLEQYRSLLNDSTVDDIDSDNDNDSDNSNINIDLLENRLYDWIESQPANISTKI